MEAIRYDSFQIKTTLLQDREKVIIENELNELLSSLNLYEQVIECLRDFQELWKLLNS